MFKVFSLFLDRKLGVSPGWGFPIALLSLAVLMQWVAIGINVALQQNMVDGYATNHVSVLGSGIGVVLI